MRSSVSARPQADTRSSECFGWDIDRPANNPNSIFYLPGIFFLITAASEQPQYPTYTLQALQAALRTMTDPACIVAVRVLITYIVFISKDKNKSLKSWKGFLASESGRSLRFHHQTRRHIGLVFFLHRGYLAGSHVSLWTVFPGLLYSSLYFRTTGISMQCPCQRGLIFL